MLYLCHLSIAIIYLGGGIEMCFVQWVTVYYLGLGRCILLGWSCRINDFSYMYMYSKTIMDPVHIPTLHS